MAGAIYSQNIYRTVELNQAALSGEPIKIQTF